MHCWFENQRRLLFNSAWFVLAFLATGCSTLTVPQEQALGRDLERELRPRLVLIRDPVVVNYIERIGNQVLEASGPQPYDFKFYVVDDPEINAFAGPGGYIYIHTGTILHARNASELSGVIAHEIAHVVHRHVAKSYDRQRQTQLARQAVVTAAGIAAGSHAAGAANIGGVLAAQAFLNAFTREDEREADAYAVEVLPKVGIDPNGLVEYFETVLAQGDSQVPTFFRSHPTTRERISLARQQIQSQQLSDELRKNDGGRFEIIQRRIRLLTGEEVP